MTAAGDEIPESLQRRLDELASGAVSSPVGVPVVPSEVPAELQARLDELEAGAGDQR